MKKWIFFVVTVCVLVALDLWLKAWAVDNLRGEAARVFIPGVLGLTYFENPGALFGFLGGLDAARWILSAVKIFILGAIAWYYSRLPHERRFWFLRVPLVLIFAGGLGNLADRVWLGIVRDMLDFLFMNFAIFNLADVYVTVGVFALIFVTMFVVKDAPLL